MNQNLDEAIYSSGSALFLVLAFSLFFITYSTQLDINENMYKFSKSNDHDLTETYVLNQTEESLVTGAQIITALMSLSQENYNMIVHGAIFEPTINFEEMNLSSIVLKDNYKIRIDRNNNGVIEQVVYQHIQ